MQVEMETLNSIKSEFNRMDRNRDGKLTAREVRIMHTSFTAEGLLGLTWLRYTQLRFLTLFQVLTWTTLTILNSVYSGARHEGRWGIRQDESPGEEGVAFFGKSQVLAQGVRRAGTHAAECALPCSLTAD